MAVSDRVPGFLPVALDGREFLVEVGGEARSGWVGEDLLRPQADQGSEPSDASVSRRLWRRYQSGWAHGAGQAVFDDERTGGDRERFERSRGLDVFTGEGRVRLLNKTALQYDEPNMTFLVSAVQTVANTPAYLLYVVGDTLFRSAEPVDVFSLAVFPSDVTAVTSDGDTWYAAAGGSVYTGSIATPAGSTLFSTPTGSDIEQLVVAKGRLLAAVGAALYEIDGAGVASLLFTHASTAFRFSTITSGPAAIYAAGFVGWSTTTFANPGTGEIYSIGIEPDTSLSEPLPLGQLPPEEGVLTLGFYVGGLAVVGTTQGIRLAHVEADGSGMTFGPLFAHNESQGQRSVAFRGQYAYVTDDNGPGLTIVDLATFTDTLTPAWASYLVADGLPVPQTVTAVVVLNSQPLFLVAGSGVWGVGPIAAPGLVVDEGWFESGLIRFGSVDNKDPQLVRISRWAPTPLGGFTGDIDVTVSSDNHTSPVEAATVTFVDADGATPDPKAVMLDPAPSFRIRVTLHRDGSQSPILSSWMLYAFPVTQQNEVVVLDLVLADRVVWENVERQGDPAGDLAFIRDRFNAGGTVDIQIGSGVAVSGKIRQFEFTPGSFTEQNHFWNGTCRVVIDIADG